MTQDSRPTARPVAPVHRAHLGTLVGLVMLVASLTACSQPAEPPVPEALTLPVSVTITIDNAEGLEGIPFLPVLSVDAVSVSDEEVPSLDPAADRNPDLAGENVLNVFSSASLTSDGTLDLTLRPLVEVSPFSRDEALRSDLARVAAACTVRAINPGGIDIVPSYEASNLELFLFAEGVEPTVPAAEPVGFVGLSTADGLTASRMLLVGSREAWSLHTLGACRVGNDAHVTELALDVQPGWHVLRIEQDLSEDGVTRERWTVQPLDVLAGDDVMGHAYLDPEDAVSEPVHVTFTVENAPRIEGKLFLPIPRFNAPPIGDGEVAEDDVLLDDALIEGTLTRDGTVDMTLIPVDDFVALSPPIWMFEIEGISAECPMSGTNLEKATMMAPGSVYYSPFGFFSFFSEATPLFVFDEEANPLDLDVVQNGVVLLVEEFGDELTRAFVLTAARTAWSLTTNGPCISEDGEYAFDVDMHLQPGWQLLELALAVEPDTGIDMTTIATRPVSLLEDLAPAGITLDENSSLSPLLR